MADIDIGPGATHRGSGFQFSAFPGTAVDLGNPANDTGTLSVFEVWCSATISNFKIGTFSGSGASYDDRDYENIGSVTSGSKQTFTGKNCDVSSGDFLGCYASTGTIERDTKGGSGFYFIYSDTFGSGSATYTDLLTGDALSIYATGATAAAGNPYYYYLNQ